MEHKGKSEIEKFLAEINGTVEALTFAFGALVATHPNPSQPLAVLNGVAHGLATKDVSEQQRAFNVGITNALRRMADAAHFARQVQEMQHAGPTQ